MYCFCDAFSSFLELGVSTFEIHRRKKVLKITNDSFSIELFLQRKSAVSVLEPSSVTYGCHVT